MQRSILPQDEAKTILFELFDEFDKNPITNDNAMFGVLVCEDEFNNKVILKAFSGQINKTYLVDGFVKPLFDLELFNKLNSKYDSILKSLINDR